MFFNQAQGLLSSEAGSSSQFRQKASDDSVVSGAGSGPLGRQFANQEQKAMETTQELSSK